MASFLNSVLSSLGGEAQTTTAPRPATSSLAPTNRPTTSNTVAGVKRKSEDPESAPRPKTAKTSQDGTPNRSSSGPPANRFQLPAKSQARPAAPTLPRPPTNPTPRPTSTPPISSQGSQPAGKGRFASILAKAQAAQAAAQAAGPNTIKHQPKQHLTKKERIRMMEEAKLQQKASRRKAGLAGSRSGAPQTTKGAAGLNKEKRVKPAEVLGYNGTMKPASAATSSGYSGTMRADRLGKTSSKSSLTARGRRDEYADTDDDDEGNSCGEEEEDEEEGGYGSDASSDMEGGLDDIEREEMASRRIAQKEDQEALAEEERLRREKEARKRKLMEMNKAAAGRRKF